MGVLADWQIRDDVTIEPLAEGVHRPGVISYGLTSYGYDLRIADYFEVAGKPLLPRQEEIDYLRFRCREEIERNRGVVGPVPLKEYEQALAAYEEIAKRLNP